MQNTSIIAVCNQKGGVGKTTTTFNLETALVQSGYKVLIVDLDPQGSLTTSLGVMLDEDTLTLSRGLQMAIEDDLDGSKVSGIIYHHNEGIDYIPADITLAGIEVSLVNAMFRETTLKRLLEDCLNVREAYDYVLIDCLPSLGMLMQNALAADNVANVLKQ